MAPHFNELLLVEANQSPFYVLLFDESLNKHLQRGQMDVLVRFWNNEKTIAESRYLTSEFLGGAKAEQLLEAFEKAVASKLGPSNLLQVSSDGPNVNLLFLQLLEEKQRFNDLPSLLNIGTCGLHTIHGSLKAAVKAMDWSIGKVLKAMWKILDETPARRDIFEKITETNVYPLPYCGHRWCENEDCIHRENIWLAFKKFIKHLKMLPKSKQPGNEGKGYVLLQKPIEDPLKVKAMFFCTY